MIHYIRISAIFFLLAPAAVLAQTDETVLGGLNAAAPPGLLRGSIPEIIGKIINAILILLGTLFTVLVLLGGFRWMTSGGSPDKIKEAKALIANATIGLAIVLLSYAIARYVLDVLLGTGQGGGGVIVDP